MTEKNTAIDLEAILQEDFSAIALQIRDQVAWWGARLDSSLSVSNILAASSDVTEEEKSEALKFFAGEQWPEAIKLARNGHPPMNGEPARPPRPCCVINRLPELVASAIANEYGPFDPSDILPAEVSAAIERVKVILTIQNRDAQMLYNYLVSAYVEAIMPRLPYTLPNGPASDAPRPDAVE